MVLKNYLKISTIQNYEISYFSKDQTDEQNIMEQRWNKGEIVGSQDKLKIEILPYFSP